MKDFVKTLFDSNQKLNFQYEEYDMAFYSGEFCSYYIVFFLKKQEELMTLWERQGEIFQNLKENKEIYDVAMDKNTLCLFCLEVSDEEYYQTGATGTVSELSKKISLVEEDLNYFTKHVLIYTDSMNQFSQKYVGKFEEVCQQYIVDEKFEQYKEDNRNNFEYDFLLNLFIKLPFLRFEKYRVIEEKKYRTVTSFVQEELKIQEINISEIQSKIEQLEKVIEDEDAFYKWLDSSINAEL